MAAECDKKRRTHPLEGDGAMERRGKILNDEKKRERRKEILSL